MRQFSFCMKEITSLCLSTGFFFFKYQVLMVAPLLLTQQPPSAPPAPLPVHKIHSDDSALCQSNHSAALFPGSPSVTCLEQGIQAGMIDYSV